MSDKKQTRDLNRNKRKKKKQAEFRRGYFSENMDIGILVQLKDPVKTEPAFDKTRLKRL